MKILCYDHGLCTEAAIKLVQAGHEVAYFTPWAQDFPEMGIVIGRDLDGLNRVENFAMALDRSDMVVAFDTFSEDKLYQAKKAGKPYFGAGEAEKLELDRIYMKETQEKLGLPTQPWRVVKGINKLIDFLKKNKDKWVKATGKHRGLVETFYHEEWNLTRSMKLGQLMVDFGPIGDSIDFLIEDPVGECEPGWDGFIVNGFPVWPAMMGYEDKDETYIGKVINGRKENPGQFNFILESLEPALRHAKTLASFEIRIDKAKKGYLIDPCLRAPHPPLACELEVFDNFADIVTEAAKGKQIASRCNAPYSAAIEIKSSWVENHWCELSFDPKYRHLVKLQKACMVNGKYWALPGSFVVATCVGLGETPEAAGKMAKRVANTFKADGMYYDEASLDKLIKKTAPEGEAYGIKF